MLDRVERSLVLLSIVSLAACMQEVEDDAALGVTVAALDACGEAVPANRNVDGIPSYAQCPAAENSPIYSNNGIDTSTTAMGSDWVRTQFSGGYQCTELAGRYLHFKWNVRWRPNGNAGSWCDTVPPASSGLVQTTTPVHGDVMVLAPGSCGASASTGHVTVVDVVDAATGKLTVVEQNGARRGSYQATCGKCYLHVVANDGTNPGNTIKPGAGQPAGAAGAPAAGAAAPAPAGRDGRRPAPAGSAAPPVVPVPGTPAAPAPSTPAPMPGTPAAPAPGTPAAGPSPASPAPTPVSSPVLGAGGAPGATPAPAPAAVSSRTPGLDRRQAADVGGCSVLRPVAASDLSPAVLALGLLALYALARSTRRRRAAAAQ